MPFAKAVSSAKKTMAYFAPPPRLTNSEWADSFRCLPVGFSAEPGKWKTSRAPYLKEPMDVFWNENVNDVTIVFASQCGKSEIILNDLGRRIHLAPCPILMVLPSIEMAEAWSEERFNSVFEETKELKNLVKDAKNKTKRNTKRHKMFTGGSLTIAGANSAASLSMRAIAHLRCDEVDRFPLTARGTAGKDEGDPISLAQARTATFHDATIIKVSSPTDEETSRIWMSFLETDQRKYFVPCPFCDHYQILDFKNLYWTEKEHNKIFYECSNCKEQIREGHKRDMLTRGRWEATAKKADGKAGFWLSALYSPWLTWAKIASEFDEAKRSRKNNQLKAFYNTKLALCWKDEVESFSSINLYMRRHPYDAQVPKGVLLLTAGVDTQDDRLEIEVVGWGHDEECWSIDYKVIWGDPSGSKVWLELDEYLGQKFETKDKIEFGIACVCVDSRGHHNSKVWGFCSKRKDRNIFAVHGVGGENRAIVGQPKKPRLGKKRLKGLVFPVGTDEAKTNIYSSLKLITFGASYCHFPIKDCYSEDYFKQLTSEVKKIIYKNGYPSKIWYLPEGKRNEALDCRVYSYAALYIYKPNYKLIEKKLNDEVERKKEAELKKEIKVVIEGASQYVIETKEPEKRVIRKPLGGRNTFI